MAHLDLSLTYFQRYFMAVCFGISFFCLLFLLEIQHWHRFWPPNLSTRLFTSPLSLGSCNACLTFKFSPEISKKHSQRNGMKEPDNTSPSLLYCACLGYINPTLINNCFARHFFLDHPCDFLSRLR
jgi:hypothetical protein